MRKGGQVPPAMFAESPHGPLHFVPHTLKDERAKNNFANIARLICVAYAATAAVLVLESWIKMAKPGETLDATTPPSESPDRQEVVVLVGESAGQQKHKLLPILRTDAGGFFGFGQFDGPELDKFQGRFSQILAPKQPDAQGRKLARLMLKALGVTEEWLGGDVTWN